MQKEGVKGTITIAFSFQSVKKKIKRPYYGTTRIRTIRTGKENGREQGKVINFSDYGLTQLVENDTAAFQHFKQFGQRLLIHNVKLYCFGNDRCLVTQFFLFLPINTALGLYARMVSKAPESSQVFEYLTSGNLARTVSEKFPHSSATLWLMVILLRILSGAGFLYTAEMERTAVWAVCGQELSGGAVVVVVVISLRAIIIQNATSAQSLSNPFAQAVMGTSTMEGSCYNHKVFSCARPVWPSGLALECKHGVFCAMPSDVQDHSGLYIDSRYSPTSRARGYSKNSTRNQLRENSLDTTATNAIKLKDTTTLRHQATESKAIKFFLVLVPHVEWLSYQLADETSHYILFSRISLLSEPSYKINALENEKGDEGMKRGDEKG
ncbi:hypothetical protein Anapl_15192 [Anas platyrhynchos]|uniref:Uncharacterized protein n=1 Tax=Anas platyrhynchos TaxID=8839 RepID=R0JAM5_ANAPL|nr:hypothetical protein Anapl_15192 [Anas platyrhynchos]